jgi:hypothetical protein
MLSLVTGDLPLDTPRTKYTADDLCAWYVRGQYDERKRIATAQAELNATWRAYGARSYEQEVRDRAAFFRERAIIFHAQALGRVYVDYTGGAVDFDTGEYHRPEPVQQARQRERTVYPPLAVVR